MFRPWIWNKAVKISIQWYGLQGKHSNVIDLCCDYSSILNSQNKRLKAISDLLLWPKIQSLYPLLHHSVLLSLLTTWLDRLLADED